MQQFLCSHCDAASLVRAPPHASLCHSAVCCIPRAVYRVYVQRCVLPRTMYSCILIDIDHVRPLTLPASAFLLCAEQRPCFSRTDHSGPHTRRSSSNSPANESLETTLASAADHAASASGNRLAYAICNFFKRVLRCASTHVAGSCVLNRCLATSSIS